MSNRKEVRKMKHVRIVVPVYEDEVGLLNEAARAERMSRGALIAKLVMPQAREIVSRSQGGA